MQVHKLTVYVVDFEGLGAGGVREAIEGADYPNRCIAPTVANCQTREAGDWSDDHPLNRADTAHAEWERLFGEGTC